MGFKQGDKVRFVKGIEAEIFPYKIFICGSNEVENKVFLEEAGTWFYADCLEKI